MAKLTAFDGEGSLRWSRPAWSNALAAANGSSQGNSGIWVIATALSGRSTRGPSFVYLRTALPAETGRRHVIDFGRCRCSGRAVRPTCSRMPERLRKGGGALVLQPRDGRAHRRSKCLGARRRFGRGAAHTPLSHYRSPLALPPKAGPLSSPVGIRRRKPLSRTLPSPRQRWASPTGVAPGVALSPAHVEPGPASWGKPWPIATGGADARRESRRSLRARRLVAPARGDPCRAGTAGSHRS